MDGHRTAHPDGYCVYAGCFLEGKHLPERAHINPGLGRFLREHLRTAFLFLLHLQNFLQGGLGLHAFADAGEAIIAAVIGLHEDRLPHVLQTVPDFPFQADIGDLSIAIIVGARLIAV